MESTDLIAQECFAARHQCVLIDHPDSVVIEVGGADRISFLHRMLTNDIKKLSPGQGAYTCLLNAQAKVLADMNVLVLENFIWLLTNLGLKDKISSLLNQAVIMDQVELIDKSDALKLISIHGPKSKDLLSRTRKNAGLPEELFYSRNVSIEDVPVVIIRLNLTGETGFGLFMPRGKENPVESKILENGEEFGLIEIHQSSFETLRIEAAIPRYGIDFDHSFLLPEVGLENAVSYTKGCFPGQEILARLDSRGGVARKLTGFELKGEKVPQKNNKIFVDEKEAGFVTSAAFSPTLKKTIALGYLKTEAQKAGHEVIVDISGDHIPARVKTAPFYTSPSASSGFKTTNR